MITNKEVKIKNIGQFESEYIENELSKLGYDVLRWAIVSADEDFYTVNIAIVKD